MIMIIMIILTKRCDKIEGGTVPINHSSPTNRNLAITRKYPVSYHVILVLMLIDIIFFFTIIRLVFPV